MLQTTPLLGGKMAATRPVMLVVQLDHTRHRWGPVRSTERQWLWLQSDLMQLVRLWWRPVSLLLCLVLWCRLWLLLLLQLVRLWWRPVPLLLCLVLWCLLWFLLLLSLPTMEAVGARKKCATIGQTDAATTKR